jgi:hypothetical protein
LATVVATKSIDIAVNIDNHSMEMAARDILDLDITEDGARTGMRWNLHILTGTEYRLFETELTVCTESPSVYLPLAFFP